MPYIRLRWFYQHPKGWNSGCDCAVLSVLRLLSKSSGSQRFQEITDLWLRRSLEAGGSAGSFGYSHRNDRIAWPRGAAKWLDLGGREYWSFVDVQVRLWQDRTGATLQVILQMCNVRGKMTWSERCRSRKNACGCATCIGN